MTPEALAVVLDALQAAYPTAHPDTAAIARWWLNDPAIARATAEQALAAVPIVRKMVARFPTEEEFAEALRVAWAQRIRSEQALTRRAAATMCDGTGWIVPVDGGPAEPCPSCNGWTRDNLGNLDGADRASAPPPPRRCPTPSSERIIHPREGRRIAAEEAARTMIGRGIDPNRKVPSVPGLSRVGTTSEFLAAVSDRKAGRG